MQPDRFTSQTSCASWDLIDFWSNKKGWKTCFLLAWLASIDPSITADCTSFLLMKIWPQSCTTHQYMSVDLIKTIDVWLLIRKPQMPRPWRPWQVPASWSLNSSLWEIDVQMFCRPLARSKASWKKLTLSSIILTTSRMRSLWAISRRTWRTSWFLITSWKTRGSDLWLNVISSPRSVLRVSWPPKNQKRYWERISIRATKAMVSLNSKPTQSRSSLLWHKTLRRRLECAHWKTYSRSSLSSVDNALLPLFLRVKTNSPMCWSMPTLRPWSHLWIETSATWWDKDKLIMMYSSMKTPTSQIFSNKLPANSLLAPPSAALPDLCLLSSRCRATFLLCSQRRFWRWSWHI